MAVGVGARVRVGVRGLGVGELSKVSHQAKKVAGVAVGDCVRVRVGVVCRQTIVPSPSSRVGVGVIVALRGRVCVGLSAANDSNSDGTRVSVGVGFGGSNST